MNPYVLMAAAIGFLVAIGVSGYEGYSLGADHVRAEYAARDLAQANEAAAALKATQDKYRAIEQEQAQSLAKVSTDYQKRLTDAQAKTALALNTIRANGLFDRSAKPQADCRGTAETAASTNGRDGASGSRLSDKFAEFLISEAARADAYTLQLTACQAVLTAERK